jgi:hypothetical protein
MIRRGEATYRVMDEPVPSTLGHLVTSPMWPLLGSMLGGLWIGLPWFIFNGFAMGSATRNREIALAVGGLASVVASSFVLVSILAGLVDRGELAPLTFRFGILGVQLLKLGTYYGLQTLQARSFGLHEYYGGQVRNGTMVVIAGAVLRSQVLGLFKDPFWILVFA